jgi:hypothetical protein
MHKIFFILALTMSVVSCAALNSHAAAARQLLYGTASEYYCFSKGSARRGGEVICIDPKDRNQVTRDIWACVRSLHNNEKEFQPVVFSRAEIVDCMTSHGWTYELVVVTG